MAKIMMAEHRYSSRGGTYDWFLNECISTFSKHIRSKLMYPPGPPKSRALKSFPLRGGGRVRWSIANAPRVHQTFPDPIVHSVGLFGDTERPADASYGLSLTQGDFGFTQFGEDLFDGRRRGMQPSFRPDPNIRGGPV